MPPSVACAVTVQGLANCKEVPECVGCNCEALGVESCESEAIDDLHDENLYRSRL